MLRQLAARISMQCTHLIIMGSIFDSSSLLYVQEPLRDHRPRHGLNWGRKPLLRAFTVAVLAAEALRIPRLRIATVTAATSSSSMEINVVALVIAVAEAFLAEDASIIDLARAAIPDDFPFLEAVAAKFALLVIAQVRQVCGWIDADITPVCINGRAEQPIAPEAREHAQV